MKFTANQNVSLGTLNTNQELIDYSTAIKAFPGGTIVNELYPNLSRSIFNDDCYSELCFANGEYMRNKINKKAWKLKPNKYLEELDKIVSVGLGIFYDNSGTATLELNEIGEFYKDTVGLSITSEFDDVSISIDESRLYNKIEIGYSNFKDTTEEIHRKNEYTISQQKKGRSTWSKITDWIASKYLIKRALRLGTEDKDLEFDNDIFLIDTRNIDTFYLHSASQNTTPSALGFDTVYENNSSQNFGMNRKYCTIFNLIRSRLRWSFGMYKSRTAMDNTSLSNKEMQIVSSSYCIDAGYYNANKSIVYDDVDGSYRQIPIFINVAHLMTLAEFLELRKKWYETVEITKDSDIYKGNILRADYKGGIVKFKLTGHA